ncbi:hypothetical protein HYH03_003910 [Edaphochlamys debaryana]|uniref:Uncharacterized protein n=1 Tax=Edaphochlamys debaryana TaxID=47281 RepID=A0A835Y8D5_9CHLO|nr:hypothetical protein HYH03_003910 [Edaphochlamys debaryana]|eukprot:KAG2498152.1 hypothetical protein HYH03_003910 [Edaphochlamys debaryana]
MAHFGKKLANLFTRKSSSQSRHIQDEDPRDAKPRHGAPLKVTTMSLDLPETTVELLLPSDDSPLGAGLRMHSVTTGLRPGAGAAPLRPSTSRRASFDQARSALSFPHSGTLPPIGNHESDQRLPEVSRRRSSVGFTSPPVSTSLSFVRLDMDGAAQEPHTTQFGVPSPGSRGLASPAGATSSPGPRSALPVWEQQSQRQILPHEQQQRERELHMQALQQRDSRHRRSSGGPSMLAGAAVAATAAFVAGLPPHADEASQCSSADCAVSGSGTTLPPPYPTRRSMDCLSSTGGQSTSLEPANQRGLRGCWVVAPDGTQLPPHPNPAAPAPPSPGAVSSPAGRGRVQRGPSFLSSLALGGPSGTTISGPQGSVASAIRPESIRRSFLNSTADIDVEAEAHCDEAGVISVGDAGTVSPGMSSLEVSTCGLPVAPVNAWQPVGSGRPTGLGRRHSFYACSPAPPTAQGGPRPPGGASRPRRRSLLASINGAEMGGAELCTLGLSSAWEEAVVGGGNLSQVSREVADGLQGCLQVHSGAQPRLARLTEHRPRRSEECFVPSMGGSVLRI